MKVLLERFPYRYTQQDSLLENGRPDYRIQKFCESRKMWVDMYPLDNEMQLLTAMEDHEYTKWLDPAGVPAYKKDVVRRRV